MTGTPFTPVMGEAWEVRALELLWQIEAFVGMAIMTFAMFVGAAFFIFGGYRRAWIRSHREDH